jgi:AcrR family transcriptional regulator
MVAPAWLTHREVCGTINATLLAVSPGAHDTMVRLDSKAPAKVDGRVSRGQRSRRRIVAALMQLVREGVITPTAEAVAMRADVGLRTVFRHFADMETLYREIAKEIDAVVAPAATRRLAGRTWRERLVESVDLRVALFERLMPFQLATAARRHESPFLDQRQREIAALQRTLLHHVVPRTIADDVPRFAALDLVLSVDSWIRLRREQRLSRTAARRVVLRAVEALIRA